MDSDNNGVGDLQGVISKLDHLVKLGVTALWLSPIYKSPMNDAGYDVSDFRAIDEKFGTMEDFDELVTKAHELGLKVVLDFVPNHTSDEHEWFKKALAGEEKYRDYYVWADGLDSGAKPPCNWISYFHGPAWTKPAGEDTQYYLHQFHASQPDLNYRNADVKQEMKDVLTFWLDKNVDGFRVDTVPSLVEDVNGDGTYPNEDPSGAEGCTENDRCFLKNDHQSDKPETFDVVYEWREHLDAYTTAKGGDARIMMTETYSSLDNIKLYYANADNSKKGAHFSFNFRFITDANKDTDADGFKKVIDDWTNAIDGALFTHNWVLGNHDQHRLATRYGSDRADGMLMLQMILPGVGVTYMGEEIGMENGAVTFQQGDDPQGCDDPEHFDTQSRDFERTPFQWDDTTNAGFNTGAEPWLPVGEKYKEVNVAKQEGDDKSALEMYKTLIALRSTRTMHEGDLLVNSLKEKKVLNVIRYLTNDAGIPYRASFLLMNTANSDVVINLADDVNPPVLPNLLLIQAASRNSEWAVNSIVSSHEPLTLKPYESLIIGY